MRAALLRGEEPALPLHLRRAPARAAAGDADAAPRGDVVTVLMVPAADGTVWPTLGPQMCQWIEAFMVFGPGDLLGLPARMDDETKGLVYEAYEVQPQFIEKRIGGTPDVSRETNPVAGRRRFNQVAWSLRKGTAKTEKGAWLTAAELHPDGPVRCDGFDARGQPVGRGVTSPYIPLMAYTEQQSDELGYAVLKTILEESPLANDFDIGYERILRKDGYGRAVSVASAPSANDGRLTTFEWFDETHRLILPRQRQAVQTMKLNLVKRLIADPWGLETTTAFSPGEDSVAEKTMDYARQIHDGKLKDAKLFFFHRQASDGYDLTDREQVRTAVLEASGPSAAWSNIEGIVDVFFDPQTDIPYAERTLLNRPRQTSMQAFDVAKWRSLALEGYRPDPGAMITIGFDGSQVEDSTGLIGEELESRIQFKIGGWEKPATGGDDWEVPQAEVDATLAWAMETWKVVRMYGDPFFWETKMAEWAGRFGEKVVAEFRTNRWAPMAYAVRAFTNAINAEELRNDGDADVTRHVGNARKMMLNIRDDRGERLHVITKERPDSPFKIDFGMASILAHEAANDAITAGALNAPPEWSGIWLPPDDEEDT